MSQKCDMTSSNQQGARRRRLRVFFVAQRVPFPPDRGDKITTFNEIRHLAQTHEVHVFCLADGERDLDNISGLLNYAATVSAVPVSKWRSIIRALRALASGEAMSVAALKEKALYDTIRCKHQELQPDLLIVYSGNVAQYAMAFSQTPRVMQFADLDSLKWEQYATSRGPVLRWLYQAEQRRLLAYERLVAATFDHSLVCTAIERRDFEELIPGVPVTVVGNGVDLDYFRPTSRMAKPGSMVFTGIMSYWPNIDAVRWFCDAILPLIREHVPHAVLTICGRSPSAAVRRLARRPGVLVTGGVSDTRPFLAGAEVFVAPMRLGRGIQNKLLEAMAMGLPVVTSTAAWRATVVPDGDGIVACDDPTEFATAIVNLLRDPDYRIEMGQKARHAVETHYGWDAQLTKLDNVISLVTRRRSGALIPESGPEVIEANGRP
jgi:sugar transferase (PEP-CTERM/EpsH1 system associated)